MHDHPFTGQDPARADGLRVVIYSHDTYGLGHLTRTQRIAAGIVEAFAEASVLIISGSPIAHRFHFPDRVDYLKLPSVVKLGPGEYGSRKLEITPRRIRRLRSRLILNAIDYFRPTLMMVDNVPLGMKGELRPALRHLRRKYPHSRIHLNMRDILDDAQTIRSSWRQTRTDLEIDELFDAINVFGSREIYDSQDEYGLPADRTQFLGYIGPRTQTQLPTLADGERPGVRTVLVTVGGGGDGEVLLDCVARLQGELGAASPFRFIIVTGPLMDTALRHGLTAQLAGQPGVQVHEYLPDLPAWMERADLVLSMGGYNTLCEVMGHAQRSVVVPRQYPRREQLIRAEALAGRGVLRVLPMDCLDPRSLRDTLELSLAEGPAIADADLPSLDGIAALQRRLRAELGPVRNSPERVPAAAAATQPQPGMAPAVVASEARGEGRPGSTGKAGLSPVKGLLLAAWLLILAPVLAGASWQPDRAQFELHLGHDSNLLDASDAERTAFSAGAPNAFFAVDAMADRFLEFAAEARWPLGRPGGVKTEFEAGYERLQYLGNAIASNERFSAALMGRFGGRTRLSLGVEHQPQVYARHREDKDAQAGDPRFRAEVYSAWEATVAIRRQLGERWQIDGSIDGLRRNYSEAFPERDRRRVELELAADYAATGVLRLGLAGGYQRSRSRNEPDLGRDLSYAEWRLRPGLTIAIPTLALEAAIQAQFSWRDYQSTRIDDWSHYGRQDRSGALTLELERQLRPGLAIVSSYTHARRRAELASTSTIDYDEEGTFSESVVSVGIDWRWEH